MWLETLMETMIVHGHSDGGTLSSTVVHFGLARQTLITDNGGRYFSSEMLVEVDDHVQSVAMHRMLEEDVTYAEALQSTRRDIVQNRAGPRFFRKLLDIVGNRILPVLKTLIGDAVACGTIAVATYCSVM